MNKKVKALIIAIVLGGGLYVVCINSHIELFPCTITDTEGNYMNKRVVERSGMCSLLMTSYPPMRDDAGKVVSNHELSIAAYPVMAIVFGGLPLFIGFMVASKLGKNDDDETPPEAPSDTAAA